METYFYNVTFKSVAGVVANPSDLILLSMVSNIFNIFDYLDYNGKECNGKVQKNTEIKTHL